MPKDFQLPGGGDFALPNDLTDTNDGPTGEDTDWHDTLFRDSPRRVPGFLLFMLILILLMFFLCGRERRLAFYTKIRSIFGLGYCRKKRGGAGASTGRFGKYDRVVLQDPEVANEFDLPPYTLGDDESDNEHSDDTEGTSSSRVGKTPGWATPTLSVGLGDLEHGSPPKRGYFGDVVVAPQSSGLGLGQTWAPGLMSRTESRERLSPRLGRGRTDSPSRLRSPALGFKESVD